MHEYSLKKCPNKELFLVRISCIWTEYGEKYGQKITPHLDTFHAVTFLKSQRAVFFGD